MEKKEPKWEQAEMEEQEQEKEESTLVVRKSRNGNASKITTTAAVDYGEVSTNRVSESNGHAENGAKIEGLLINTENEQRKLEQQLDGVLENEPEAINGEQKKENIVFFDKAQGVDSTSTNFEEKLDISSSLDFIVQNDSTTAINDKYEGDIENNTFSSSNHHPSQLSSQEHSTSHNEPSKEIENSAGVDIIDEDDLEVTEFDVESVIKKQTTHDLFCPNCNSCITRKVILRKRKRRVRVSDEEVKRNKTETAVEFILGKGSVRSCGDHIRHTGAVDDNDAQVATADEDERERGPDIFRCLSCFSFFIPAGNGFKSFKLFGDKSGKEKIEDEQVPPSVKKNWFTSMFASNKPETAFEQDATMEQFDSYTGDQLNESQSSKEVQVSLENNLSVSTISTRTQVTNGESANDALSFSQQGGLKLLISSNNGSLSNSEEGQITNQMMQSGVADKEATQVSTPVSELKASDVDGNFNISVSIPHQEQDVRATVLTESVIDNKNANFSSIDPGQVYHPEASQHITTKTEIEVHSDEPLKFDNISVSRGAPFPQGKDTVITINSQPDGFSQTVQDTTSLSETTSLLQSSTQSNIAGRERTEERKEYEIEVIKSIVYGGLAESITSLSVVSSAAGGGAATLNILALGMANLIGGLFIIGHNLWELKCGHRIEQVTNQFSDQVTEQNDRYKQLLGRRQNFVLHAIVSIISYIIFGLVPPAVYGFSFRKTDDKELKLVVVAAASLFCIVVLAIGRAHVRRPPRPYLKSVTIFVILGFMVSGISYAAGELVERLLEKLGLFETSPVTNLLVNEMMGPMGTSWASY